MTENPYNPYNRACPSRRLLHEIGDIWTVLIIGALTEGPLRFKDLAAQVDGISNKMLTQTLRTLERDGLIERKQYQEVPLRVEYSLNDLGRELVGPLKSLEDWATAHMDRILQQRESFDAHTSS